VYVPDPGFHVDIFHSKVFGSGEMEGKLVWPSPLCCCWKGGHEATINWENPGKLLQVTGAGSTEVLRDGTHRQSMLPRRVSPCFLKICYFYSQGSIFFCIFVKECALKV